MQELIDILNGGDSAADLAFAKLYFAAWGDRSVRLALNRVAVAEKALIDEGAHFEVAAAVNQSLAGGGSVAQILRERELQLIRQRELSRAERAVFIEAANARRAEAAPILAACAREQLELAQTIAALELEVSAGRVHNRREASLTAMLDAGLTSEQIEAIGGPKPTENELAAQQASLAAMRARMARLKAFAGSAPFFDRTLLGDSTGATNGCQ
ncbi:hypothetical protein [Paraburkholderia ginsengisoli]|uniref:Uncharacterized protein n=1 Tax=Paraburkholderia ginsengisoli TaxID=311231 RepID=A0A7T4T8G3_9BURK|nr:hypothetical protein [Paraburkholderia ginsengisoli]QQC63872.1 hypothetical protein I6I06_16535 [Paraburkholderia ginsengisoli]